ncbi:MAG: ATP-binding cassette domain-containing protein [Spirochaetales bacterium]|nr:ATP-binding cassette domain-containing protein [Spirochaetales bacterium]
MISVEKLTKQYTTYQRGHRFWETLKSIFIRKKINVDALKGISFTIKEGELLGLIGPNGAGKSTTIKILTGILYPTGGSVQSMGYVPWKDRQKYVKHIGVVFGQKSQLIWDIPPIDSFYMNKAIYDIDHASYESRLKKMGDILNAHEIMRKPTRQLSLGERMRCEFIMAMLHNPPLVFLDEPTIGLDVIAKETIRNFIMEMNKQGVTFILTTHDMDDLEHLAKRVIVINHGEIVFEGNMESLKTHLGTKKVLRLATHENLNIQEIEGISDINRLSDFEIQLELDTKIISIDPTFRTAKTCFFYLILVDFLIFDRKYD